MEKRAAFSGKLGFILATAGSAVGMGNIWRFPYLAAKYGGGIFLLVYVILVVTFGFSVMIAEIGIGRRTGLSPIKAYDKLSSRYKFVGIIQIMVPLLIIPYYGLIGGWVLKYFAAFILGAGAETAADGFFDGYISTPLEPVLWQIIFIVMSGITVIAGVKKGIERVNRFSMPVLIAISIAISIYSCTLPGAWKGVVYFLRPDISKFSPQTILAALGQMFYSLSLAMGIMITYGSYLSKEDDVENAVKNIEIFDTLVAILAGFMIIPAVFAFSNGDPNILGTGPGLMFVMMPKVFASMGFGMVVGSAFFFLVILAAITSLISLFEVVVASLADQYGLSRRAATVSVVIFGVVVGVPPSLGFGAWDFVKIMGMGILDFMDFITNSVLMPIEAFLTCIFIGYIVGTHVISEEIEISSRFKRKKMFVVMIKYIAPIFIILILATAILGTMGILTI